MKKLVKALIISTALVLVTVQTACGIPGKYENSNQKFNQGGASSSTQDGRYTGEEIIPDSSDSVEDTVVRKLMLEKLRKCLALLPQDERSLILQIHAEDKSCRKIAFEAGIPQRTMNDHKNRILQKLKRLLEN